VIWLYAVCEPLDRRLPCVRGLGGAPVEGIAAGPLVAVATRHEQPPDTGSPSALWTYERVVEAVHAQRPALPMRFGTSLPDEESVRAALSARRGLLLAGLERVRDRVELAVRAMEPRARERNGHAYLQRRQKAAALHTALAGRAVAARRAPERAPDELLRGAYLIERAGLASFGLAVERLQRDHPETALVCTGPWPAYSFVEPLQ
jgi:Gas vesicle synthesis protein GvpL/GvpF